MGILSPLSLLHRKRYKAFTATKGDDDLRLVVAELEAKMACVAEGNLDVTVGFANHNDDIGDLGRSFNQMVLQLRESRNEMERLHRDRISRAECLATTRELATGLAHEIRNVLSGIAGVIEIVDRDLPVNSSPRASVKLLGAEITQVNRILTDLLHAARPHLPEIRSSDLNATVEQAVMLVRQQSLSTPIRIELHKDLKVLPVEHDSGQICQLVLNLLLNALQAIDGAGAIRVEVSLCEGDATITVVDTGRGIAPEHLPDIFRPFYTTKGSGTGLGLSLARRTAEEHHGRIGVTSAVGKGATFAVTLPLLQNQGKRGGILSLHLPARRCRSLGICGQSDGIGGRAMLAKCINVSCFASFRDLADGRLFRLETDPPAWSSDARGIEYFWLCTECSVGMTLGLARDGTVATTVLSDALLGAPQVALNSVDRGNRLFLRRVSFLPRSHPKTT